MDFDERVIPGVSSNFMFQEALARYEFARNFTKPSFKIIDIGCGTGYGTSFLKCAMGVDIDREAINFAKKHYGKKARFKIMDIMKLKFKKESFNMAVSFEVIEHIKDVNLMLKNVKRILKKDGIFILSTPNASIISPNGSVSSPYHVKEFKYDELLELLRREFSSIEVFGQGKSKRATLAWRNFMNSQSVRQKFVDKDRLGLRKLVSKKYKEKMWKYFGNFFGRNFQEDLETKDFLITKREIKKCYYFVAVCRK